VGSRPFSAITIPPIEPPARSFKEEVLNASRSQYGNPRAGVEELIYNELMPPTPAPSAAAPRTETKAPSKAQEYATRPRTDTPVSEDRPRRKAQEAPRREQPVQSRSGQPRTDRPAPQKEKSAEDLKDILRATIAKAEAEKGKKKEQKESGLKDALREAVVTPTPAVTATPEVPKGAKPFEIPEETLRSIFKDV